MSKIMALAAAVDEEIKNLQHENIELRTLINELYTKDIKKTELIKEFLTRLEEM